MKKSIGGAGVGAWLLAGAVCCGNAMAAGMGGTGITGDVGTTGVGLHLSIPVSQTLNARVGMNYFSGSFDGSTGSIDYHYNVKLNTYDALLDWFPFDNAFRLTGGVSYNNNRITANGTPHNGTYTVNGNTYLASTAGTLDGDASFRHIAPYLGVGYGNAVAPDKGWGFSADAGVLFQGGGTTNLTNANCTAGALLCGQLANDTAEERARLADKVNDYRFFPVVRIGASYRF